MAGTQIQLPGSWMVLRGGVERERGAGFIYKKMIFCTIKHSRNENS